MDLPIAPFVMVIFGATGDLTARKLMPAIYSLFSQKILPEEFFVVGFARRPFTHEEFRLLMREALEKHSKKEIKPDLWEKISANLYYQQGLFEEEKPYLKLIELLSTFDKKMGACITRFFYLATPPQYYSNILLRLEKTGLAQGCGQGSNKWTRVLIEKPFGKDLETAKKLEEQLSLSFEEKQIYRIDHYLAKETVQNILALRFANHLFKNIWNREHIDNVQITLAEKGGIGKRGEFYDALGALKDVAQNHLMAILAYVAMEEPENFSAEAIRRRRVEVLSQINPLVGYPSHPYIIRGQYGAGRGEKGEKIPAYREEEGVSPSSLTETYVAFRLFVENNRWEGVPFYLRTGKRLKESIAAVDIQFKNIKGKLFKEFHFPEENHANFLRIRIQPREGITFSFFAKAPGLTSELVPVTMDFFYSSAFKAEIADSYERILIDAMRGDQTLFATSAGFFATWEYVNKVEKFWKRLSPPSFPNYTPGSWGPKEADKLLGREGRRWLLV